MMVKEEGDDVDLESWEHLLSRGEEPQDDIRRHAEEQAIRRKRERYRQAVRRFQEVKAERNPRNAASKARRILLPLVENSWTLEDLPEEFIREVEEFAAQGESLFAPYMHPGALIGQDKAAQEVPHDRHWKRPNLARDPITKRVVLSEIHNQIILDTSWHPDTIQELEHDTSVLFAQIGAINTDIARPQNNYEEEWKSAEIDLSPLQRLPNLRSLVLFIEGPKVDLAPLADLANLQDIGLRLARHPRDLRPLSACPSLRNLDIRLYDQKNPRLALDELGTCTQIENLEIRTSEEDLDLTPLDACSSLHRLKYRFRGHGLVFPSNPALKEIDLSENNLITRFSIDTAGFRFPRDWPAWPWLRGIKLTRGPRRKRKRLLSLETLADCSSLRLLNLRDCQTILSIDLSEMDGLGLERVSVDLRGAVLHSIRLSSEPGIRPVLPRGWRIHRSSDGIHVVERTPFTERDW
jgi:hypothetical protein